MTQILQQYGLELILLFISFVGAFIGFSLKKLYTDICNTKEKQEIAKQVVYYVEQVYKSATSQEKLTEALTKFAELLSAKGIETTNAELRVYIEAALAAAQDVFKKETI